MTSAHSRVRGWAFKGAWNNLFISVPHCHDVEIVMIDSTIVRAHACSAGYGQNNQEQEALGCSKSDFSSKIHTLVDALGNPLKFILTSGQRHDTTQAPKVIDTISNVIVVADKGYDSNAFIELIKTNDCTPAIPCKRNRKIQHLCDQHLYKERHLIKCFFGKIKNFRHVFSRFNKSASSFLSFLHFVTTFIWLR